MTSASEENRNYYDEMFALRDRQREEQKSAILLLTGDDLPWESNPQGLFRWYVAPTMTGLGTNTLLVFEQRIPAGGHSGRQRQQGGLLGYVRAGSGYSIIDGTRHEWTEGDLIQIPLPRDGSVFQHFASEDSEEVVIFWTQPNVFHTLGVDRGCGTEQLSNASTFTGGEPS